MKKRRTIIISFLLLATLIMGVGYAALADTLTIGGRASFTPSTAISNEIKSVIYFDSTYSLNVNRYGDSENIIPTLSVGYPDGVAKPNSSTVAVAFNGVEGRDNYKATVTLKIVYEESDEIPLPDVTIDVIPLAIANGVNAVEGFKTPVVELYTLDDSNAEVVVTPNSTHISPGTDVYARLTIEYDLTGITAPTEMVAGTIDVTLNCNTVTQ